MRVRHARLCAMLAAVSSLGVRPAICGATEATTVPFIVGLTTVRAVETPEGDYESLRVVDAIDAQGYRITASAQVPGDDGDGPIDVQVTCRISAVDQRSARKMRVYFHTGDAESFPGTVPGISAAVLEDLRRSGRALLTVVDVGELFGVAVARRELTGTITRVTGGPATLPVIVNGRVTALPVIHAAGELTQDDEAEDYDFYFLDDPRNPMVLRSKGPDMASNILRIEYPEPAARGSLERALANHDVATVYGVYFSFAKADLRKPSDAVLAEIAAILAANPGWKLRIDGHTDGIGSDAANLELSRRRAAAVKQALVTRFHVDATRLTTGGYGESAPKATNATPEGRALNRRVELRRE